MVRQLLSSCHDAVRALPSKDSNAISVGDFLTDEVPRLLRERDEYLDRPDQEYHGRTPRSIIENERARIPETMNSMHSNIDDDCPLCQMQADMPGPFFWHLDGCNMDDEFAFSFHATQQEWDDERREWEEHSRRFNAERAECERLGVKYPGSGYSDPDYTWDETFSKPDKKGDSVFLRLFSIGSQLAGLIADIKMPFAESELPTERRDFITRLSRDFGNLRELAQSHDVAKTTALMEPVLDRFCESLDAVSVAYDDLAQECERLQSRLLRFLEPPPDFAHETDLEVDEGEDDEFDHDLPF
jgi:hypothetical protein